MEQMEVLTKLIRPYDLQKTFIILIVSMPALKFPENKKYHNLINIYRCSCFLKSYTHDSKKNCLVIRANYQLPFFKSKSIIKRSHPEVFLRKGVLKICSKFAGEHPRRNAISIKLHSNFIEIALRHGVLL